MNSKDFVEGLKQRLLIEFKKQDRSGVYGYTQRSMAYNSNKIEGSTLTEKQTASMFDTGTLYTDDPDVIFRTKDIEEMNGHFKMFNYIMKNMYEPLSEDLIKEMHKNLKEGVFDDFANGYAVGEWKKRENRVSDINVALPKEVPEKIHQLLASYTGKENIELKDIAEFQDRAVKTARSIFIDFEERHTNDAHISAEYKTDQYSKPKHKKSSRVFFLSIMNVFSKGYAGTR